MSRRSAILIGLFLIAGPAASQGPAAPYRNAALPIDARVRDLLGRMTLEEKFWQLFMIPGSLDDSTHDYSHGGFGLQIAAGPGGARAHAERINAIQKFFVERTRLGIPIIPFEEALHGLAREGATVFPQAIALAATWDTALMGRVALASARETGSRGIRQVLSPVVNLATDVRWGRVEETYGEDPFLASAMAAAFVRPFERSGIIATPKHFVANVGEGGRDSYPIDLSPRLLEELHFPPFRSALAAGARSVMTSYNSVDGSPASQNRPLLDSILKGAWGFKGFVISDAAATGGAIVLHRTEASTATAAKHALESGLDVIFQSSWEQHRSWLAAFRNGTISDAVIDKAVARVLRAKFELGLFERPFVIPDSAAHWNGHAEHRALARAAARASLVLLRNEGEVLPLSPRHRRIAVIGTDAVEARLGGYSGPGIRPVSILDGIRQRAGSGTTVRYTPGPGRFATIAVPVPAGALALRAEYFDNITLAGAPRVTRTDSVVDFRWTFNAPARGIPTDWYSVRWTGTVRLPPGRSRRIGVEGTDGYRLWLDGTLVVDNWKKQSYRTRMVGAPLPAGSRHDIRLEYFETTGNARVRLVWDGEPDSSGAAIDSAVALARGGDVVVLVAGIEEGEFRDRARLSLPGRQEDLIRAVAATGTPVVVVLVGGSAITMSGWLDEAEGVLLAWYPGEEGGRAVADVLFGDANPAGRLPVTFPMAEGQLPLSYNHKPTGRGDDYLDLSGQPLFPFGFGLSYATFEYSDLRITPAAIGPDARAVVRLRVRNTGTRAGDEVVQLYVRDVLASVARPVLMLAGFQRIGLGPGEEREVSFALGPEQLRMLDADMRWVVEPGTFRVLVGGSSRDIRLRGDLVVR
ncbi:MAG TPA: glycoside hydrolase family 3 N-terminal domain-containing protein [Gemmatimonadales bacterium]|nr:glycoside hydrolase family 3 N-terminal domain-containing protein [Gemmatimonadales bacterium]